MSKPRKSRSKSRKLVGRLPDLAARADQQVTGGGLATVIANLANMRHESLKAVAQNLRA
jgi:hypothetical protein